ncbi:uncharacterized protein AKAW2_51908S [Aspergillus luchuensis]|uniref:Similar to An06g01470 n=1 Tax=Aspergillus kawachii TaxID=1069201 RepID=A0A146F9Y7_ASPKA|nr:uncharacterized protein AKAW2_51908S [Aspergillus luchuensis]BCS01567.1 hypothetical protein AKAW2_51908S [Aspergillus luchuensis]BCS13282.1 hypothetical protein ALUC_51328S [Aspergillus luchuensis]GAA87992.1 similar to An06g01470 [Aspergillus luchuensis IFO 4308]GAT22767.1 similar to An06g01470 [Aspergillus luchuensis]
MSARISRSWLALATRNSSVPFLYQTRTLTAAYLSPPFRQQYSTSSDANEQDHEAAATTTAEPTQDDKPARPVRRSFLRKKAAAVTQQQQQQTPTKPAPQKPVTMTSTEKQIFGNLLEQLGTERRQQSQTELTSSTPSASSSTESKPTLRDEEMDEMAQISAIFDSVLQDMKEKRQRSAARTERQESEIAVREQNTAIEEKLQTGEYTDDELAEMISSKQITMDRAIEAVIMRESVSIEAALWDAIDNRRGDTAIWEVCKERIFNILRHLDDEKKGLLGVKDESTSESFLAIPPVVPTEPVVTELYPKMLLVAFKLLNLHYPESHLISQFRATIKSMGRASAVLGGSTALYNEFIYFYWRGCHDLPGVVSLLRDMEVTGVEPNRRTCGLLHSIKNQRDHDLRNHWRKAKVEGKQGKANREPWWDLAPNRKAVRELFGDDGWVKKLEGRVKEIERARDY